MSATHAPALDAITFQLAAALEQYERSVQRMVDGWLDMDRYRSVSAQIEEIRMYSASLPQLSAPWVELLIAHAELVHCLWRSEHGASLQDGRTLPQVREHHGQCVEILRGRCLRLLARGD
jgi:hypothetical protein